MSDSTYDSELPILAELEAEIGRAAQGRFASADLRTEPLPTPPRRRGSLRIPRRVAVLAALICMVGATATATVTIWRSAPIEATERVPIAEGAPPEAYRLELHELHGRLCVTLLLGETVDSDCLRPLGDREVAARVAETSFTQFVYGLAGPATRSIEVLAGTERARAPSRPLPATAREALPQARDQRYFVVAIPRIRGRRVLMVRSSDGADRAAGECSFRGVNGAGCRSR